MRKFVALGTIFVCGVQTLLHAGVTAAASDVPTQVDLSVHIRSNTSARAVTYASTSSSGAPTEELAVIVGTGQNARVVWHHRLPGAAAGLTSDGPANVFIVLGKPSGSESFAGAYRVSGDSVRSAIIGTSSGLLMADRGAHPVASGFTVLRADAAHTGLVPYVLRLRYRWSIGAYRNDRTTEAPDLASSSYPTPNAVIHAASGSVALLRLQVASDAASRDKGLMFVTSMDPDDGMIFTWPTDVLETFWMENTYIPLTVAFISSAGVVQEMQDMAALSTDFHTPVAPYRYAIEANLGYFSHFGVRVGDTVTLNLGSG